MPAPVITRVERVCVHPNGALVTRRGEAPGPGPLFLDGLPLLYAADSLRVSTAAGSLRDIRERCSLAGPDPTAAPAPAEARAALDDRIRAAEAELAALETKIQLYTQLTAGPPPEAAHHLPPAEALTALDDAAAARLSALEAERGAALETLRRLRDERTHAARPAPQPAPPRFTRGLALTLADTEGPTAIEIEYFVAAARWVPSYRVDLDGDRATLRLDALIAQASGEDWSDAEIALATADLSRDTTLPELTSWRIGTAQTPRPKWRPLPGDLETLFAGYDRDRGQGLSVTVARPQTPPQPPAPVIEPEPELEAQELADEGVFGASNRFEAMDDGPERARGAPQPRMAQRAFAPPSPGMPPPAPPPPGMPPAPSRAAPQRKSSFGASADTLGGGGGPSEPITHATLAPPEALSDRLRYAWLRLEGPDTVGRGTLRPVDPRIHLSSLLEHFDLSHARHLRQALDALRLAAHRLHQAPLPPGTVPVDRAGWHHRYPAAGRHSVAADGDFHRIAVRQDTAPAQLRYRAVPRHSPDVHRHATLATPRGVPYPAGPLQVYIDGRYRVTAALAAQARGGQLDLALGLEPGVRIVERTARIQQGDRGLMSQTTRVDHEIITRIRNSLDHPIQIKIHDRLPTPDADQKDLTVSLLEGSPPPAETDRDPEDRPLPGGLSWTCDVPAGQTTAITWRYRIELPAKLELSGGNRRE